MIKNPKYYRIITVNQIEKVFKSASHKKVWDHFTKAQVSLYKHKCI